MYVYKGSFQYSQDYYDHYSDHMLNKIAIQCSYNNCKKHAQLFILSINCTISLLSSKSALIDIIGALIWLFADILITDIKHMLKSIKHNRSDVMYSIILVIS